MQGQAHTAPRVNDDPRITAMQRMTESIEALDRVAAELGATVSRALGQPHHTDRPAPAAKLVLAGFPDACEKIEAIYNSIANSTDALQSLA